MGNLQSKLKRNSNKLTVVKRTIKLFSVAPDIKIAIDVLQKETNAVISAIFNGALNVRQYALTIPLHLIHLLGTIPSTLTYLLIVKCQFILSDT